MKKRKLVNSFMGLYLLFFSCGVFAQENVGPIGTALAAEVDGCWYMMPIKDGAEQTPCIRVGYVNGKIILPENKLETGNLVVDEDQKVIYAKGANPLYLYPSKSDFSLTFGYVGSNIPNYWESFILNDGKEAWKFTKWDDERFICMFYKETKGYLAFCILSSYYYNDSERYTPLTDYPIYDGWYRHYDTEYLYSTFCPSRNVASVADISGAEFYALLGKVVDKTGQVTQLVFEGPCSRLDAGKSYLLKRQEGVQTVSVLYSGERKTEPVVTNGMTGSFAGITAGNELTGKYVLYQDRFVKCAKGSSLIPNGAYIDLDAVPELTTEIPFAALRFSLPQHNGTTTVEALQCEPGEILQIYSLSGKLLMKTSSPDWYSNLKSGIYIVNGKKIKK